MCLSKMEVFFLVVQQCGLSKSFCSPLIPSTKDVSKLSMFNEINGQLWLPLGAAVVKNSQLRYQSAVLWHWNQ